MRIRNLINIHFACVLAFFSASVAFAAPTGLTWVPSDQVLAAQVFRFDSFIYFAQPFINEGLTYGLFNNSQMAGEAGVEWWEPQGQDNLRSPHLHLKFSALENAESSGLPALTFGAYAFGLKANTTDEDIIFVELGKTWAPVGHFFAGYFVGNPNVLLDDAGNPANRGFLAGIEKSLSEKFSLRSDFQSGVSAVSEVSLGFGWQISPETKLALGYCYFLNHRLARDTVAAQISVDL